MCNRLFHAANNNFVETNLVSFNVALNAAQLNVEQQLAKSNSKRAKVTRKSQSIIKCIYNI